MEGQEEVAEERGGSGRSTLRNPVAVGGTKAPGADSSVLTDDGQLPNTLVAASCDLTEQCVGVLVATSLLKDNSTVDVDTTVDPRLDQLAKLDFDSLSR